MIVANCHKVPAKEFSRYRLSIDETLAALKEITAFPGKQYIFTVSPIRHLADGEHGNQLSKATLLLATDALISQAAAQASQAAGRETTAKYYFPAYEIVMDELRDFRHYAEDTVHPSAETAEYIFSRFSANCLK